MLSNISIWIMSSLLKTKIIWWTHGYNISLKNNSIAYVFDRVVKTFMMRHAHKVLLYTEYNKTELLARGIPNQRIIILNNAIDQAPHHMHFSHLDNDIVQDIGELTIHSQHTISFIGNLSKRKRLDLLIEIASKVRNVFDDLRVFIIGDGEEFVSLNRLVYQYGLSANVFFFGTINDPAILSKLMYCTDIIICPAASGLAVVTAMVYGVPFVTLADEHQGPEISYIISDYNGYLARDIEDCCTWVTHTFNEPQKRDEMRDHCLHVVRTEVNLDKMVSRFQEAFS